MHAETAQAAILLIAIFVQIRLSRRYVLFTVIVPTHKRPELLSRTLQSLIAQTFTQFSVVIVDDAASHLPPYSELQALQGRYTFIIRSGAAGPAESRNMALSMVRTKYVLFLDDDDTLEPEHLQSLANQIGSGSPEILFSDFKICNEDRTTSPPTHLSLDTFSIADVTKDSIYVRNRIPNSCLVYRSDVVANVLYETQMQIYEDWDFLLMCLRGHQLNHVPISSVVIHKSVANAPENMRRGNTRDDLIVEAMLYLYKKHPAPNEATRLERQSLMSSAGIAIPLTEC
jgi:glycosyltransferase involved in cell wall biosynthesis